jgi:hypothetical protein
LVIQASDTSGFGRAYAQTCATLKEKMLKATSTRDLSLAARALRKALGVNSLDPSMTHDQALQVVARLAGYPSHMAAAAALKQQHATVSCGHTAVTKVATYADLLKVLQRLPASQLGQSISVSEGCDANGDAEFFDVNCVVPAGHPSMLSGSDGVLETDQLVLIFNDLDFQDY